MGNIKQKNSYQYTLNFVCGGYDIDIKRVDDGPSVGQQPPAPSSNTGTFQLSGNFRNTGRSKLIGYTGISMPFLPK